MPSFLQGLFGPNYGKLENLVNWKTHEEVSDRIRYLQRTDPSRLKKELEWRNRVGHAPLHSTIGEYSDLHQKQIALLNAGADPHLPFPDGSTMIFQAILDEKINVARLFIWHAPHYEHLKLPATAIGFLERISEWHADITVLEAIEKWHGGSLNPTYQQVFGSDGDIKGILQTITEDAKVVHELRRKTEAALAENRYQEAIECCANAAELCDKQAAIESEIPYPRYNYEIKSRPHLVKLYRDHGIGFREKIAMIYLQWEKALGDQAPSVDNFSARIQLIQKLITVYQNLQQPKKVQQTQKHIQRLNRELQNFRAENSRPSSLPVNPARWNRFGLFSSRPRAPRLPAPLPEAPIIVAPTNLRH